MLICSLCLHMDMNVSIHLHVLAMERLVALCTRRKSTFTSHLRIMYMCCKSVGTHLLTYLQSCKYVTHLPLYLLHIYYPGKCVTYLQMYLQYIYVAYTSSDLS